MEEDFLITEQRHRELLSALKSLSRVVDEKQIDVSFLMEIAPALESLRTKIDLIKQPEAKDISPMFREMNNNIIKGFVNLEQSLLSLRKAEEKWDFSVERDNFKGLITRVIATKL